MRVSAASNRATTLSGYNYLRIGYMHLLLCTEGCRSVFSATHEDFVIMAALSDHSSLSCPNQNADACLQHLAPHTSKDRQEILRVKVVDRAGCV